MYIIIIVYCFIMLMENVIIKEEKNGSCLTVGLSPKTNWWRRAYI